MANTVSIEVNADTNKASRNIGGLSGKIGKLAKPMAVASAAATGLAVGAVKMADEFKQAENTIRAGTGATGKDLEALEKSFSNVFKGVPNDSASVATAIADLNTELGLTGEDLESASVAFLNLSRTMGDDASNAIKAVADGLVAFGEPAENVESHLDALTVASQAVGVPVTQLADKVVKFAPQLKTMGLSLEESTALFANMEAQGIQATKMMPGLSTAMKKMANEGVKDMGKGLQDLITDIANTEDTTLAMQKATDAFGAGAGVRFFDAIKSGAMDFGDLQTAMQNSEGALASLGEETLTTGDKMDILKNKVKDQLAPMLGMVDTIGPMIMIIPALTTVISGLSAAMGALSISMGPVLIAVGAIALAIGAAILIWKNWDTIVEVSTKVFNGFKETITGVLEAVWGAIKFYVNLWIGAFNFLIRGMNKINFSVPSWIPEFGGKEFGFNVPEIPKLAKGGIVTKPTLALVGEAGPEAVVPLGKGGGGMSNVVQVTIAGDVFGFDDFEDRIFEAVKDGARRGGFDGVLSTA
jgi:TP901 family phage tail tape measure protein